MQKQLELKDNTQRGLNKRGFHKDRTTYTRNLHTRRLKKFIHKE